MEAIFVGDIICPKCDESLDAAAERCTRCDARTEVATPISLKQDRTLNKPWVVVVMVLHVGLLGIPMYWKLNYSTSVRLMIIVASIVYTIFAVAVIIYFIYWLIAMFSG